MQIFVLDTSATLAAGLHCDAHVNKLIVEATQILYAALHLRDIQPVGDGYALTHKHHHLVLWAAGARAHLRWLLDLGDALCAEYQLRAFLSTQSYKIHACAPHLARIRLAVDDPAHTNLPEQISAGGWLTWVAEVVKVSKAACMNIVQAVATCSPPDGCLFGVLDIDPNPRWGPKLDPEAYAEAKRALTRRCAVTGDIDLVASYRLYYAKKAKADFAFTWAGAARPPPPLQSAWAAHRPDCAPITLAEQRAAESARRAEKKRKRAEAAAA
jgi:hypothetical protein